MAEAMQRLLRYLTLPAEISAFEARYLRRTNRMALVLFWLHLPVFVGVAALAGTSKLLAFVLTLVVLVGPTLACLGLPDRPRTVSVIHGVTAMMMGGVLVFIGQGPLQIEMHFYFFVLIALLAVFANPLVIVAAAATVAAHHLVTWIVIPRGIFNHAATVWTVAVHALFVVIESVAASFVARSFFDNVIGLERIVRRRTEALHGRNRDMMRIFDNVAQGLVTVQLDGSIGRERSRALEQWFGVPTPDMKIWSLLAGHDANLEAWMQVCFDTVREDIMPLEVGLSQLPERIDRGDRQYRIEYRPIGEPVNSLLLVVSDITDELARRRAETTQRELIEVVERAYGDRSGFLTFLREADGLVRSIETSDGRSPELLKRQLHTLKGTSALFGVHTIAQACHAMENAMEETGDLPTAQHLRALVDSWSAFRDRIERLLGISQRRTVIVDWDEYTETVRAVEERDPPSAERLRRWGQEEARVHLQRFAEQATLLARRLGKCELDVEVEAHGIFLDADRYAPVWAALVHAIRNAVDHGLETAADRRAAGKPERGHLALRASLASGQLEISIADDGAGIDWAAIAVRAGALGLPAATPQDLENALFSSGLSTTQEVTETSGRGVGLDALRAACVELGGSVRVASARGRGTTLRCLVPLGTARRLAAAS